MNSMKEHFFYDNQSEWEEVMTGVTRKIVGFDNKLMLVKVRFKKDCSAPPHQHPHSQVSCILTGKFEIRMGDDVKILSAGDGFYVPPGVVHSATAIEAGEILDSFSPLREEFVKT